MNRNLIALAVAGLVVGANAAFADTNVDTDPYWKNPVGPKVEQQAARDTAAQAAQTNAAFDNFNRYNP